MSDGHGHLYDASNISLENHMRNFTLHCDNEEVNCHVEVPSSECLFLWLGQDSTAAMAYGMLKHRSVIYGNPSPLCAIQINEFANRLARLFGHRQVFVSTDLDQETDSMFWSNLFLSMKDYVMANHEFFRLPTPNTMDDQSADPSPATPASTISNSSESQH